MSSTCSRKFFNLIKSSSSTSQGGLKQSSHQRRVVSFNQRRHKHVLTSKSEVCDTYPNIIPITKPNISCLLPQQIIQRLISTDNPDRTNNNDSYSSANELTSPSDCSETLFRLFKRADSDHIDINHFIKEIEERGIYRSDPRISSFMRKVDAYKTQCFQSSSSENSTNVDQHVFHELITDNIALLWDILQNQLVIPEFQFFTENIRHIYEKCKTNNGGKLPTYIPQLARYSRDLWACSVCTVDGQRYSIGDVNTPFTLQSCSKPFTYSICLNELGVDVVQDYVGHEPSGRNFNEIFLDVNDKPHNPMLNSGAIMSAALSSSMIQPHMRPAEKFDFIANYFRRIAGGLYIGFNNSVFLSERDTADRNFAMAYYMKEHKCFPPKANLRSCMDLYFQLCSLESTTNSLAVMGATLANGGVCPLTDEKVIDSPCIRDVLSLMYSCGMYNYSGQFAFKVGLPAKSGVSGALLLIVPNVMSIALWSPPLDVIGNSVRGLQFSEELVKLYNFHRFDNIRFSERKLDPLRYGQEHRGLSTFQMLSAAKSGDVSALKRLYVQGKDMNSVDYDGRTALHVASAEGQMECVKFILSTKTIQTLSKDRWEFTAVDDAERFGFKDIANLIKNSIIELQHSI